jgi:hypothetical protein
VHHATSHLHPPPPLHPLNLKRGLIFLTNTVTFIKRDFNLQTTNVPLIEGERWEPLVNFGLTYYRAFFKRTGCFTNQFTQLTLLRQSASLTDFMQQDLLGKLTVAQQSNKLPAPYGNLSFITAFTRYTYFFLSEPDQSDSAPISIRYMYVITSFASRSF